MADEQGGPAKLGLKELVAIGVGGMVGGGIFSVMGLAVEITGNATPIAFLLGALLAMITGYSYIKLALAYRGDGASFTYLERAFPKQPAIGSFTGWTVIAGYIGTLSLYAFTFGAYSSDLLGVSSSTITRQFLSVGIILFFMIVNLNGVRSSGSTEDILVYSKIMLLGLLAIAGFSSIKVSKLTPFFSHRWDSVFIAGALIFVAYEGFQLITNAVCESENPTRNVPAGIFTSIGIVAVIYISLSVIAVGSLSVTQLIAAKEYALAVAVVPALGQVGKVIVSLAALLATSSAINATMFGASRMMAEMATQKEMPKAFSWRNRVSVPWMAIVTMSALTCALTYFGGLEFIAAFSSLTFLLVSLGIAIANIKLRKETFSNLPITIIGTVLLAITIIILITYMATNSLDLLAWIAGFYGVVFVSGIIFRKNQHPGRL